MGAGGPAGSTSLHVEADGAEEVAEGLGGQSIGLLFHVHHATLVRPA